MSALLSNLYLPAAVLGAVCLGGLAAGFNLALGTKRKAGLRLITVCAGLLVALCITVGLLLIHG